MEEDEYRATYNTVNERRCIYEKALNARQVGCSCMRRFYLADREGVGCQSDEALARCTAFLERTRDSARFALQMPRIGGPLPHNKEIRVQAGGLLGLQALLDPERDGATTVDDAFDLLNRAEARFGDVGRIPYQEVVKQVTRFRGRERRSRR